MGDYLRKGLAALAFTASMLIGKESYSQSEKQDSVIIDPNKHYRFDYVHGEFTEWDYSKSDSLSLIKIDERLKRERKVKNNRRDNYAFLISGYDETRFKFDISITYQVLLESGFKKENIYILDETGEEQYLYKSDGIASKKSLEKILSHLEKIVDEKDLFVFNIGGHGGRTIDYTKILGIKMDTLVIKKAYTNFKSRSQPWSYPEEFAPIFIKPVYDSMTFVGMQGARATMFIYGMQPEIDMFTQKDLSRHLSRINPGVGLVTTGICFGGGIVEEITKKHYIVISASKENEIAGVAEKHSFTGYFYQAFRTKEADVSHDKRITVDEAFEYAKKKMADLPIHPKDRKSWLKDIPILPTPLMSTRNLNIKNISLKD